MSFLHDISGPLYHSFISAVDDFNETKPLALKSFLAVDWFNSSLKEKLFFGYFKKVSTFFRCLSEEIQKHICQLHFKMWSSSLLMLELAQ